MIRFAFLLLATCPMWAIAATTTLAPERLVACASAYLQGLPSSVAGQLELEPTPPAESHLDADPAAVTLEAGTIAGAWPRARVGVPVRILVEGKTQQTRMVWFSAKWWAQVPVYADRYAKGTDYASLTTRSARVNVAGLTERGRAVTDEALVAQLRLRREVRAGDVLLASDFQQPRTVEQRERVMLRLTQGAVVVRMPALAIDGGQAGELIAVVPEGAHASVKARVVARGEVAIER
ncbi:flagella basal body P-ring formation protein FlgA [uncultured Xanthomonas sp.]|uniref:flagella basal body P-ring formation protein FlgA n=1 Tax=Xanthomonas sontii TaxID=2650745 RepID=UPI0025CCAEFF|nr:flagella basal body P-ring formation protein FlgA [uncultured Xanthomonas sp.]